MNDLDDYEGDPALERERLSQLLTDQLEELTRAIHSRDQLVRARAASQLVNLDVEPELALPALNHRRGKVREVAAEAIGYSSKPLSATAIDALLAAIDDPQPFVAAAAIRTLGRRQVNEARQQIAACLDDPEPPIVAAAIVALARLNDTALAVALPDFLNSPHLTIRIAAAEAAGILQAPAAVPGLLRLLEDCLIAWHEGQPRMPSRAASVAMQTLARMRARAAVPLLIEIARYVVGLRTLATRALIQLQAVEAAPAIAPLLNEEGSHLVLEVVRFLHMANYRAALPELRALLHRSAPNRWRLLIKVMHVLVEWHDRESLPLIARIAENASQPELRHYAARCLEALQNQTCHSLPVQQPPASLPELTLPLSLSNRLQQRRQRIGRFTLDSIVEGTVLRVLSYGAVIDLGSVEGFVHARDIDWRWINDARAALQPGQTVRAVVTGIDETRLRVNLSIRRLSPDPWADIHQRLAVGMHINGVITGVTGFGVFVELLTGVQGLIHTSQIPPHQRPLREHFATGRRISVIVRNIDSERRRIALSLHEELQQHAAHQ
ncbi:S1 RNA-binding domain-containing protein [Chloroflexus sp.]|uniref:S1 RNA-binding domain-containing protein n=1 Tax=Chloroflexus sp. TaxID=1904827 RepID=UPI002614DB91|nr:S1 RNA-binding domain-containing protein [uncultured Chloroflexus sp.]